MPLVPLAKLRKHAVNKHRDDSILVLYYIDLQKINMFTHMHTCRGGNSKLIRSFRSFLALVYEKTRSHLPYFGMRNPTHSWSGSKIN